jgi:hypothetical protein
VIPESTDPRVNSAYIHQISTRFLKKGSNFVDRAITPEHIRLALSGATL